MSDPTQGGPAAAPNAQPPAGTQTGTVTQELVPGSPEHRAAMIAAYDAQFAKAAPAQVEGKPADSAGSSAQTGAATQAATAASGDPPRLTDPTKSEGEANDNQAEGGKTLGDLYASGDFAKGFAAEKLPDALTAALKATGLNDEAITALHSQFRAGQQAMAKELTANLHKAAGGAEQFNALIAWGQKNLTAEQREFYDVQLNGPNAAEAIAVLKQRMAASTDPQIHNVNANASPAATGFRDKAEMIAAMSDPRYTSSEAFRADVQAKLRASKF